MTIRQVKHTTCGSIVLLDTQPTVRHDPATGQQASLPQYVLRCPTCKTIVPMDELTPRGAVCVLFTQQ